MSLKNIPLAYDYRTDSCNIIDSFYIPCLGESSRYWRAVGYFTSQGLVAAAKGLAVFLTRGGEMRLVASPWFDQEDSDAFIKGYEARESVVERALLRVFEDLILGDQSALFMDRLGCIAWLIAEKRLEVRIAVSLRNLIEHKPGIYHEKIGLFFDFEGNTVAFSGSPNETVGGLVTNFESLDVYMSWDDPHSRVERKKANFEHLWSNSTEGLQIFEFPEAVRKQLIKFRPEKLPTGDPESEDKSIYHVPAALRMPRRIGVPNDIKLRWYQEDASNAWLSKGGIGLLSMATGSGKTFTALASSVHLLARHGCLFVLVACPFKHLVDQWEKESKKFGFHPILAYESRVNWQDIIKKQTLDYSLSNRKVVFVITTHSTFMSKVMQDSLSKIRGPALLIADEVHHLGAERGLQSLPSQFKYRMGLSATPQRWFDPEGTFEIEQYFGEIVYEFTLKQAIEEGCLCKYYYYPHLVQLSSDELEEYEALTKKIGQLLGASIKPDEHPLLDVILRRMALLNNAQDKLVLLRELIKENEDLHHALFYCTPEQIDEVVRILGYDYNIRVHPFTFRESAKKRNQLLKDFDGGELQALVAMRCLDEGVDVPGTRLGYLLASSSNPREFIQRRGRLLRNAPGKEFSSIHDMIAVPSTSRQRKASDPELFNLERRIMKRELSRFKEFAECAKNCHQAIEVVWELAKYYNLMDF
ncbi:MAG: DEAD/DEAH box helicase family protein [Thermodesulfobacteriota bacterium]